jgi:hypothetical protein
MAFRSYPGLFVCCQCSDWPGSHADGSSIDFAELQKFSGAASAKDRGFVPKPVSKTHRMELTLDCTDAMDACESKPSMSGPAKPFDATAQAERVKAAMARPGPSVHVEDLDLAQNPFASHVPLTAPSKYRCVMLYYACQLVALVHTQASSHLLCALNFL